MDCDGILKVLELAGDRIAELENKVAYLEYALKEAEAKLQEAQK